MCGLIVTRIKLMNSRKVTESRLYEVLKILLGVIPLIALLGQVIVIMIASASSNPQDLIDMVATLIIPMGISLLLVIITKYVDDVLMNMSRNAELQEIKTTIDNSIQTQIETGFKRISHEIQHFNNASIELLATDTEFYAHLTKSRNEAKKVVYLTQLDPWPPKNYENQNSTRKSYFEMDVQYLNDHPNVLVYRILSIETVEKLEWVKGLIQATSGYSNFFLAYVNIDSIQDSVPFPKMLSLQIIDKEEVFCLNPRFSHMPRDYEPCYRFKNKDVAEIYVDYYQKIWEILKSGRPEHGCILKNGIDIEGYQKKLDEIKVKIDK